MSLQRFINLISSDNGSPESRAANEIVPLVTNAPLDPPIVFDVRSTIGNEYDFWEDSFESWTQNVVSNSPLFAARLASESNEDGSLDTDKQAHNLIVSALLYEEKHYLSLVFLKGTDALSMDSKDGAAFLRDFERDSRPEFLAMAFKLDYLRWFLSRYHGQRLSLAFSQYPYSEVKEVEIEKDGKKVKSWDVETLESVEYFIKTKGEQFDLKFPSDDSDDSFSWYKAIQTEIENKDNELLAELNAVSSKAELVGLMEKWTELASDALSFDVQSDVKSSLLRQGKRQNLENSRLDISVLDNASASYVEAHMAGVPVIFDTLLYFVMYKRFLSLNPDTKKQLLQERLKKLDTLSTSKKQTAVDFLLTSFDANCLFPSVNREVGYPYGWGTEEPWFFLKKKDRFIIDSGDKDFLIDVLEGNIQPKDESKVKRENNYLVVQLNKDTELFFPFDIDDDGYSTRRVVRKEVEFSVKEEFYEQKFRFDFTKNKEVVEFTREATYRWVPKKGLVGRLLDKNPVFKLANDRFKEYPLFEVNKKDLMKVLQSYLPSSHRIVDKGLFKDNFEHLIDFIGASPLFYAEVVKNGELLFLKNTSRRYFKEDMNANKRRLSAYEDGAVFLVACILPSSTIPEIQGASAMENLPLLPSDAFWLDEKSGWIGTWANKVVWDVFYGSAENPGNVGLFYDDSSWVVVFGIVIRSLETNKETWISWNDIIKKALKLARLAKTDDRLKLQLEAMRPRTDLQVQRFVNSVSSFGLAYTNEAFDKQDSSVDSNRHSYGFDMNDLFLIGTYFEPSLTTNLGLAGPKTSDESPFKSVSISFLYERLYEDLVKADTSRYCNFVDAQPTMLFRQDLNLGRKRKSVVLPFDSFVMNQLESYAKQTGNYLFPILFDTKDKTVPWFGVHKSHGNDGPEYQTSGFVTSGRFKLFPKPDGEYDADEEVTFQEVNLSSKLFPAVTVTDILEDSVEYLGTAIQLRWYARFFDYIEREMESLFPKGFMFEVNEFRFRKIWFNQVSNSMFNWYGNIASKAYQKPTITWDDIAPQNPIQEPKVLSEKTVMNFLKTISPRPLFKTVGFERESESEVISTSKRIRGEKYFSDRQLVSALYFSSQIAGLNSKTKLEFLIESTVELYENAKIEFSRLLNENLPLEFLVLKTNSDGKPMVKFDRYEERPNINEATFQGGVQNNDEEEVQSAKKKKLGAIDIEELFDPKATFRLTASFVVYTTQTISETTLQEEIRRVYKFLERKGFKFLDQTPAPIEITPSCTLWQHILLRVLWIKEHTVGKTLVERGNLFNAILSLPYVGNIVELELKRLFELKDKTFIVNSESKNLNLLPRWIVFPKFHIWPSVPNGLKRKKRS